VPEEQAQGSPLIDPEKVNLSSSVPATVVPTAAVPSPKKKPTADELKPGEYCWGVGRRKSAVARVRIRPGSGKVTINKRELENYFPLVQDSQAVLGPLETAHCRDRFDVFVNINGGGSTGQAGATVLGLARALVVADPDTFPALRDAGYLTRDSRMKERKKYGQRGARRRYQFSKR
jgi:small subunit ribosomal protein S9